MAQEVSIGGVGGVIPPVTPYSFKYEKAELTADRGGILDLRDAILEFNVFERIDKNYLTAELIFIDNVNINEIVNWQGTEQFEIEIHNTRDYETAFKKKFIVVQINESKKGQDAAAVYSLQLVEDIYFKSLIDLINNSYLGQPHEMISQILADSGLEREVEFDLPPVQSRFKYLVPNISALEAISNICNISTDENGFPYYCYSELGSNKLVFRSLGEMLTTKPHGSTSFSYRSQKTQKQAALPLEISSRIIENYRHWNSTNLLNQIKNGSIGSDWSFVNLNQFSVSDLHYSFIPSGVNLKKYLPRNQQNVLYDEFAFDGIHNKRNARIIYPYLSNLYSDYEYNINDVDENDGYNRRMVSNSLRSMVSKEPIDVQIPGYNFFPRYGTTKGVGNIIPLVFYNNFVDADLIADPTAGIDRKMSGEYLITHCRHHFNLNRYDVALTCTKFSIGSEVNPGEYGP